MIKNLFIAGCGGFIGTCCRYLINNLFTSYLLFNLPVATFTVNVAGCFIFGLIAGLILKLNNTALFITNFFLVGFCGAFTTFSTFANEFLTLQQNRDNFSAFLYMALSLIVGIFALWIGKKLVA